MADRNIRICTVRGKDHRGYPLTVKVEAYSVLEAAARGLDEIRKADGMASDLTVTEHLPGKEWKVEMEKLLNWVTAHGLSDNVGLRSVKRSVKDFLEGRTDEASA